jgi:hypothetical protein
MLRRRNRDKQARELARLLAAIDAAGAEQRVTAPVKHVRVSVGAGAARAV